MATKKVRKEDCFQNGSFKHSLYFTALYDKLPNEFAIDTEINMESVDLKKLKEEFPNAEFNTKFLTNQSEEPCPKYKLIGNIAYDIYKSVIIGFDDRLIFSISEDCIQLFYDDQDPNEIIDRILKVIELKDGKPKEAEVQLVVFNQGYYTIESKIEATTLDINEVYNDDFKPAMDEIEKFLEEKKTGLILLRGEAGTGKTTLIRHLITNYPNNYIIINNSLVSQLGSPEFISFMLDNKNSIFILEDCEQVLMTREGVNFGGDIATILNMGDGLMSDIFNIKFICTFNADIEKIDPAILRKGRCFVNYEFKKLDAEKTKVLLAKQDISIDNPEPMTLAEIFNYNDMDCTEKNANKIGF